MNSKMGGELYNIAFPPEISKKKVMIMGIDVCHAGSSSIVGFCASINEKMSKYFSASINQKKG